MTRVKIWVLATLLLGFVLPVLAQQSPTTTANGAVPTLVNFSGRLTDVNGKPLSGVLGVTFYLCKDQQGGSPLWMETQNVQPDKNGHYSVMLGSTTSPGLPTDLFASGEARWLGVQVQGQAEQPRVLLLSVPYALKAVDAETLSGKPASAFVLAETGSRRGDTGVITSATSGKTTTGQPLASISGSGTKNKVAKFTGTSSIGNSAIFESGGKVGIGNTSPAGPLDVSGNAFIRGKVGIGTTTPFATLDVVAPNQAGLFIRGPENRVGAGLDLQTTGAGGLQWEILDTGALAAQGPNKLNIRNVNTGIDVLTILANGEVGIGTTVPDNTLTVNGSADKPGGGSWGTFSDVRLKTVAGTYGAGLDAILKLTPVRYRYKEQNAMSIKDGEEHVGFVAQDVEKVIPEAVTRNSRGYLLVNNDPILWTMLNAIKQQQAEIRTLTRFAHEKDAKIQRLTEQAQELQKLQHQMAGLRGAAGAS